MHHIDSYRRRSAEGWSRIDMLLAIYDAAISQVQTVRDQLGQAPWTPLSPSMVLRTQHLLLLLLEGIDPRAGEAAENVQRLLSACLSWVGTSSESNWAGVAKVLESLRAGFRHVGDEARRMEQSGTIPPLDWHTTAVCPPA